MVVVLVDEDDVHVRVLQIPRRPDAGEASAEDQDPGVRAAVLGAVRHGVTSTGLLAAGGGPRRDGWSSDEPAPDAEHLGDRPGLERAAGRGVWRRAVGCLRDRAETPVPEVCLEPVQQVVDGETDVARRIDVRADQPRPDGALVIGGVAFGRPAAVIRLVGGVARRQGAQSERREQLPSARCDHRGRRFVVSGQRRVGERDRQQLVRPDGRVVAPGPVDHVEEPRAVGSDEAGEERAAGPVGERRPKVLRVLAGRQPGGDLQRPDPQRVDLDGLAGARRDGDPVDAGVHPRQCPAFGPLPEQSVGRVDADPETGAVDVVPGDLIDDRSQLVPEVVVAGHGDVPVDRVDKPERPVDGVVLERAGVRGVREHPLGDGRGGRAQDLAALVPAVRAQVEAFVRRHQVARPLAEPGVAGDRGRPSLGPDRELVRGEHEPGIDRVRRARAAQHLASARPRRGHDLAGGRKLAVERRRRRGHLVRLSGGEVDARSFRPPRRPRGRSARAPPPPSPGCPGTTRRPRSSRRRQPCRRPRRRSRRPFARRRVGRSRAARRARSAMCRGASARDARIGCLGAAGGRHPQHSGREQARAHAPPRCLRSATASAGRRPRGRRRREARGREG